MAPNRTKTIKNKHAAPKGGAKRSATDGVSKSSRKPKTKNGKGGATVSQQVKEKGLAGKLLKRPKKKVYSEKELEIPALNMVTPVGVVKPKGLKKGKVFVDDKESMSTILSIVQAEKEGHIESKMIKARQMEEIREARRVEAEKRAEDKKSKLEDTKESLRKRRKRKNAGEEDSLKSISLTGTKATKMKKRVAFA